MNTAGDGEAAVSVEIQPDRGDYTRAYRRRFWRSLGWLVICGAALALLPVIRAYAFRSELVSGRWDAILSAAIAYLAVALFLAFMVELLARSFARYALRKTPAALAPQVVTFSEDGMDSRGRHIGWSEFSRVVETRSAFQFQLRAGGFMLLPQRQIPSTDDVRNILRKHLGKRARLR